MSIYPFSLFSSVTDDHYHEPLQEIMEDIDLSLFINDAEFDKLYPEYIGLKSIKHWTPLFAVQKAAEFLAVPGSTVLDIGSGIGKFCLAAGYHFPDTHFYGVEQRRELVHLAEEVKQHTQLNNVNFIYSNFTAINFKEFDHFYFYNAFYENIDQQNQIDDSIVTSPQLYDYYTRYLFTVLNEKPVGTRLVTFHSFEEEIPPEYKLADISYYSLLKMWIKE